MLYEVLWVVCLWPFSTTIIYFLMCIFPHHEYARFHLKKAGKHSPQYRSEHPGMQYRSEHEHFHCVEFPGVINR